MATKYESAKTHSDCSSSVIIRKKMDISSEKACKIPVGVSIKASKINKEWSYVQTNDESGYVMNQFLVYGE